MTLALSAASPPSSEPARVRYTWSNVAIGAGGLVPGLVFHPTTPDLLYARTDVGGIYRYEPAAERWIPLQDDINRSHWQWHGIASLALDATDPDRIYAAAGSYPQAWGEPGALLRSTNRGDTWETFPLPFKLPGNADGRNTGERLLVQPGRESTLWLGSAQTGLWRSDDRGETWTSLRELPQTMVTVVFATPSPSFGDAPILYAAFQPHDAATPPLWRSIDGGTQWSALPDQPTGLLIQHIARDAAGVLYLSYTDELGPNGIKAGELWKYDPGNGAWTNLTPSLANGAARANHGFAAVATNPLQPHTLIVSSLNRWQLGNQVWRSTDSGETWISCFEGATWDHQGIAYAESFQPHWITDLAIDPANPQRVWFVTGYGLWFTDEIAPATGRAPHWKFLNRGLEETVAEELISPPHGAPLLSALGDIGGFRHDDLTVSPPTGAFGPGHGSSSSIAYAGLAPSELVRTHSGEQRAARSSDGGISWRLLATTPPAAIAHGPGSLVINADASRLLWLPKGGALHVSNDDGATWTTSSLEFIAPANHRTARLVADSTDPGLCSLYSPEDGRFWTSTDGGETWAMTQIFATDGGIPRAEPGQPGVVWVPTGTGLFVSTNQGQSFAKLARVDAAYQIGFGRAAPGALRESLFMQGRVDGIEGLFRSDNSGATWMRIDDPAHRYGWLRVVTGDGQVHGRVYLGTSGRGIIVGHPVEE